MTGMPDVPPRPRLVWGVGCCQSLDVLVTHFHGHQDTHGGGGAPQGTGSEMAAGARLLGEPFTENSFAFVTSSGALTVCQSSYTEGG